jgi:prepilin-type N-terminal cleavage/methylation domain-containing protein
MREMSRPSGQSGFSLVELLVAMLVTLVVTGAVYGLMAGGNNAFRREPELTDRQQNARVAMDMIQRDISNAGVNMGPFFQSFTRNLNAAGRITGPRGQVADHLEIFGNDGTCPDAPTSNGDGKAGNPPRPTDGNNINFRSGVPSCYGEDAMVLVVYANGMARWGLAHEIHGGPNGNGDTNFPPGQQPPESQITSVATLESYNGADPVAMSPLQLVRYEIAMDPPGSTTATGSPALYRSASGGRNVGDGTYHAPITVADVAAGNWQVLARGVEDLQVQYRNGAANWSDDPGAVGCAGTCTTPSAAEYNTAVREVRVTMTVRAEGQNLQGQSTSSAAGTGSRANAVRGDVTTVTSVKALQTYLAEAPRTAACPECPVWR